MATRRALSGTSVADAEPAFDSFFERSDAEQPSFEGEKSGVQRIKRSAVERGDDEDLDALKARIERTSVEPKNEVQERYDALMVGRYHSQICRSKELYLMLRARLAMTNVSFADYDQAIENPGRVREEGLQMGEESFRSMAEEYKALRRDLVRERAGYEGACKRLHLLAQEAAPSEKGKAAKAERLSLFVEAQHEIASVYELILAKRGNIAFEEAITLHEMAVRSLHQMKLPKDENQLPSVDRHALLTIRYFYQQIEKQLDQIRTRELRPVKELAEQARLAEVAHRAEEAKSKKAELSQLLTRLAPLYLVDDASQSPAVLNVRAEYHMTKAWIKELTAWLNSGRLTDTAAAQERILVLGAKAEALRDQAYPAGICLSTAPIEAFTQAA